MSYGTNLALKNMILGVCLLNKAEHASLGLYSNWFIVWILKYNMDSAKQKDVLEN